MKVDASFRRVSSRDVHNQLEMTRLETRLNRLPLNN